MTTLRQTTDPAPERLRPLTTVRRLAPVRRLASVRPVAALRRPVAAVLLGTGATVTVALLATVALGGASPSLLQTGAPPWWVAPSLRAVRDVAAVLTTGLLLVASGVFSPSGTTPAPAAAPDVPGARPHVAGTRWTVACSLVAAAAATGHLLAVSATVSGLGLVEPGGPTALLEVLGAVEVTRMLAYAVIALLLVTAGAARARDALALRRVAAVAVLAVALLGVAGHAGGHEAAMGVLAVHVLAASAWVGGLAALLLLRLSRDDVAALLPRYSRVAGGCLAAVAGSGLVAVALRLDGFGGGGLDPTWALLAAAKLVLVGALVLLGLQQRSRVVARARRGGPLPWPVLVRLGLAELLLMAVAGGLGVALAGSAAG